jgi:hypothetical protein
MLRAELPLSDFLLSTLQAASEIRFQGLQKPGARSAAVGEDD